MPVKSLTLLSICPTHVDFCSSGISPGSPDISIKKIVELTEEDEDFQLMLDYWLNGVSTL